MPQAIRLTYGQLYRILLDLGFVDESVEGSHIAYHHAASETVLVFAIHQANDSVTEPALVSTCRHLDEKGLLKE